MLTGSWFSRFWTRLRERVIQDVPASLEQCESCRAIDCVQERWQTCARRLASEAERLSLSSDDGVAPNGATRSQEKPWYLSAEDPSNESEDGSAFRSEDGSEDGSEAVGTAGPRS
jgi:hypothetical protein